MAEFDSGELNDLSQAGQSAKQKSGKAASSLNKSRKKIQNKLKAKKQAKKTKEQTEKTAKRTKKIIAAICSSTVALAIVAGLLVLIIIFAVISVAASSSSSSSSDGYSGGSGGGSDARARIVQLAREQVGNSGERYWNEIAGGADEWCAMYVRWLLKHADIDTSQYSLNNCASCFMDEGLRVGGWHDRGTYTPQPGDIIVYGKSRTCRQHVGIVVESSDGYVTTNEGNTSGSNMYNTKVDEHHYSLSYSWILGYWEFPYPASSSGETGPAGHINASEAEQKVYAYFTSHGLSRAATCGIMGNIKQECQFDSYWYFAEYVADAGGASGNSGGIAMWYDDNNYRFRRDCPNWKTSLDAQIEYLYQTLIKNDNGTLPTSQKYSYGCAGCWTKLKKVSNTKAGAAEAASIFCWNYERPNASMVGPREEYARNYWDKVTG